MSVQGRKILVLESDRTVAFPLAASLRKNGWLVLSAPDAAASMSVARQQKPDAVLLNSKLAGGGGLVALKRLRSSIYTTLIPVICIVEPESAESAQLIAAGAQETIDPPGDHEAIDEALRRHLARRGEPVNVPPALLGAPEREAAIAQSRLAGTPVDEKLDRVTSLATRLLGVPSAMLSIVEKERQFVKSQVGLSEPLATKRESPLTHSFCQWVAGGNEDLVVEDARTHPVLQSNLAIRDFGVIAYAGVPFAVAAGEPIGSFCAIDSKPRPWTKEQMTILRDLAIVMRAVAILPLDVAADVKTGAVASGILRAAELLVRERPAAAERKDLALIIEELGNELAALTA